MRPFLETDRLTLRRFTDADADALDDLHNDPAVTRLINGGRPIPRAVIVGETLPRFVASGFFAAIVRSTGEFAGWFHLRAPEGVPADELELGYRLHRWAWGRGSATEGSLALVDKAFTELGARRVFARTMTVNTRSRRVMEKIGLRHVRTFFVEWPDPLPGSDQGEVEYALTRAEYLERS